jgi:hypothetical protein
MPDFNSILMSSLMGNPFAAAAAAAAANPFAAGLPPLPSHLLGAGGMLPPSFSGSNGGGDMQMELLAALASNPAALAGLDPSMFSALAQLNSLSNNVAQKEDTTTSKSTSSKSSSMSKSSHQSSKNSSTSQHQPQQKRAKLDDSSNGGGLDLSMRKDNGNSGSPSSKMMKSKK